MASTKRLGTYIQRMHHLAHQGKDDRHHHVVQHEPHRRRKTVCRLSSFCIPWAHNNNFEPGIPSCHGQGPHGLCVLDIGVCIQCHERLPEICDPSRTAANSSTEEVLIETRFTPSIFTPGTASALTARTAFLNLSLLINSSTRSHIA